MNKNWQTMIGKFTKTLESFIFIVTYKTALCAIRLNKKNPRIVYDTNLIGCNMIWSEYGQEQLRGSLTWVDPV